ncbi:MAG: hypothetical protein KOO60_09180 [Gemmatimonadales bacterium]|nr:hypothetical protein [Gemmatimonadales bacterium]
MNYVRLLVIFTVLLSALAPSRAENPVFDNEQFLADLRKQNTDFNWVDLDEDVVVIGELTQIEFCRLRYGNVLAGPWIPHARAKIQVCRWVAGPDTPELELHYASVVYIDENDQIGRYEIAAAPWLIPDQTLLLIASPSPAKHEDGNGVEITYFVKTIRYLADDCGDDNQPIFKYSGSDFCPSLATGTEGLDLARCMVVHQRKTTQTLGNVIASILNNREE